MLDPAHKLCVRGTGSLIPMHEVARRFRELRGKRGQKEIAAVLGETQQWVSNLERGETRLLVDDVPRYGAALGYRAEVVIAPLGTDPAELVEAATTASPEAVQAALDVLRYLDGMHPRLRKTIRDILAEEQATDAAKAG